MELTTRRNFLLLAILIVAVVAISPVIPHLRWFTGIDEAVLRYETSRRIDDIGDALRAHVLTCGRSSPKVYLANLAYASKYTVVRKDAARFEPGEIVLLLDTLDKNTYQQMVPIAVVVVDATTTERRSVFIMYSMFASPGYKEMSLQELHEFVSLSDPVAAMEWLNNPDQ